MSSIDTIFAIIETDSSYDEGDIDELIMRLLKLKYELFEEGNNNEDI